jgi:hypothetical protein
MRILQSVGKRVLWLFAVAATLIILIGVAVGVTALSDFLTHHFLIPTMAVLTLILIGVAVYIVESVRPKA